MIDLVPYVSYRFMSKSMCMRMPELHFPIQGKLRPFVWNEVETKTKAAKEKNMRCLQTMNIKHLKRFP